MQGEQLRPNEKTTITHLAELGSRMYHSGHYGEYSRRLTPLHTTAQRELGHMSVTDGVFIPTEAPDESTSTL